MKVQIAKAGFCIGITRAYRKMNERALNEDTFTVMHQNSEGEHDTLRRIERGDPDLLELYPGLGKLSVSHDVSSLREGDRLVLGFHGLTRETKKDLADRGVDLVDDLICPFIAKLDRVVERAVADGFDVAIVGTKANHHCRTAQKIAEEHGRRCFVLERADDVELLPRDDAHRIALVGQVTGNTETFKEIIERLQKSGSPVKIFKTMCSDSHSRQKAAVELAAEADLVILVDDGKDASQSVFEVCSRVNPRVYRVRSNDDIRAEWFAGATNTVIVGGILMPDWSLQSAAQHIRDMCATASA
jgi:(E)-4-hydroxy-3-methyl-but-2-enyl pyrophosphate reductase